MLGLLLQGEKMNLTNNILWSMNEVCKCNQSADFTNLGLIALTLIGIVGLFMFWSVIRYMVGSDGPI